jgi:CRP-like cAMP-binding protein
VFGERAMLTGEPRSADVRAATAVEVIEVDRGALAGVIETNEALADELARRMAERDPVTGEPSGAIEVEADRGVVAQLRKHLLRMVGGR